WNLAVELAPTSRRGAVYGPASTFDDEVGLILEIKEGPWEYEWTPLNADTFATTGGDGEHYSILHVNDGRSIDECPIVMTVPMAFEAANHIVGETFREFLCLAGHVGFTVPPGLAYESERARALRTLALSRREDTDTEGRARLELFSKRLSLAPWPHVEQRLEDLRLQYMPMLKLRS
ncbi:MAG: hypothetical protein ACKVS8_03630, partial [Phycisphaerales bacterium]